MVLERIESQTSEELQPSRVGEKFIEPRRDFVEQGAVALEPEDLLDLTPYGIAGIGTGVFGVKFGKRAATTAEKKLVKEGLDEYGKFIGKKKMTYPIFDEKLHNAIKAAYTDKEGSEASELLSDVLSSYNKQYHELPAAERAAFMQSLRAKYLKPPRTVNAAVQQAVKEGKVTEVAKTQKELADEIAEQRRVIAEERYAQKQVNKEIEDFYESQKPFKDKVYKTLGKNKAAIFWAGFTTTIATLGLSSFASWPAVEGTDFKGQSVRGLIKRLQEGKITPEGAAEELRTLEEFVDGADSVSREALAASRQHPILNTFFRVNIDSIEEKLKGNLLDFQIARKELLDELNAIRTGAYSSGKPYEGTGALKGTSDLFTGGLSAEDIARYGVPRGLTIPGIQGYIKSKKAEEAAGIRTSQTLQQQGIAPSDINKTIFEGRGSEDPEKRRTANYLEELQGTQKAEQASQEEQLSAAGLSTEEINKALGREPTEFQKQAAQITPEMLKAAGGNYEQALKNLKEGSYFRQSA